MRKSDLNQIPPYLVLTKLRGQTPLEVITMWRAEHAEFVEVPIAYAGRLDPMAKGKLLILIGDECKKLKSYTKLDKEYELEILLDIGSDSGDILGLPEYQGKETKPVPTYIQRALKNEIGSHSRRYPAFSSKTVDGKPLFLYALEGTLDTITIPEHIETIYRISLVDTYELETDKLRGRIQELLRIVPTTTEQSKVLGANFRQTKIRACWEELFANMKKRQFHVLRLRVTCASGVYMRTLAKHIAQSLGTTGLALSIDRTKIGKYQVLPAIMGFWKKEYV